MIINHTCKSEFQDMLYGVGRRVANPMKAAGSVRCTACGVVIQGAKTASAEKGDKKDNAKKNGKV